MAGNETAGEVKGVGDRFPALKQLEEDVERAKLDQALVEARTKAFTAKLPDLDVEVARDAVTEAEKTTGLARVLVQMCSSVLADDVAGLALDAARRATTPRPNQPRRYRVRVIDDPEAVRDVDLFRVIDEQLRNLVARIDDYAPEARDDGEAGEVQDKALDLGVAGPVVGLGVQAVGLVSKLLARDYQVSGVEVAVDDLGFDLLLAKRLDEQLKQDEELRVEVDRVFATPDAPILNRVWGLAASTDQRVTPVVAAAAASLAEAEAALSAGETAVTALDAQILELVKRLPDTEGGTGGGGLASHLAELRNQRTALADGLPVRRAEVAVARERHHRGTALLKDVEAFLTDALTPANNGGRAPVMRAARVASLASNDPTEVAPEPERQEEEVYATYFLFCRLLAGGVDRTIEAKIGADRWSSLSGTVVEFAVLDAGGDLCTSGVRSVLHAWEMKLGDAEHAKDARPNYVPIEREQAD